MSSGRPQRGFSLLELAVAVLILGIIAAVAFPSSATLTPDKVDLAANEVADALRFARGESLRVGVPHGVHIDAGENRVRVFRADATGSPPGVVYDVYHPVSKMPFDIDLDDLRATSNVDVATISADFRGACADPEYVLFDTSGTPTCISPASTVAVRYVLRVAQGELSRDVVVHGFVGRVTVE